MTRSYNDIPRFKDVTEAEWNDYHWQLRNRLHTTDDFAGVLNLSDQQRADLDACMGRFRVSVTPYYASLMDPDDPACPVRMQGVPSPAELVIRHEDVKDAVSEDVDSPTPRITHRYPDRVLFVVTEMCSMYCRHCTRRRLVGGSEAMVRKTEIDNAIRYIERSPEVRDVLLSGGDPLGAVRSPSRRDHPAHPRHSARGDHPLGHARTGGLSAAHHARARGDAQEVPARCTSTRTSTTPRSSRRRASVPATCSPTAASPWGTRRCSCVVSTIAPRS